jgi:hypothetical protein
MVESLEQAVRIHAEAKALREQTAATVDDDPHPQSALVDGVASEQATEPRDPQDHSDTLQTDSDGPAEIASWHGEAADDGSLQQRPAAVPAITERTAKDASDEHTQDTADAPQRGSPAETAHRGRFPVLAAAGAAAVVFAGGIWGSQLLGSRGLEPGDLVQLDPWTEWLEPSALPDMVSLSDPAPLPRHIASAATVALWSTSREGLGASVAVVSPSLIETLQVPLLQGRSLQANDSDLALAIISEESSNEWFSGESPLGVQLRLGGIDY